MFHKNGWHTLFGPCTRPKAIWPLVEAICPAGLRLWPVAREEQDGIPHSLPAEKYQAEINAWFLSSRAATKASSCGTINWFPACARRTHHHRPPLTQHTYDTLEQRLSEVSRKHKARFGWIACLYLESSKRAF